MKKGFRINVSDARFLKDFGVKKVDESEKAIRLLCNGFKEPLPFPRRRRREMSPEHINKYQ